jgi:toxin ParE1/3/4
MARVIITDLADADTARILEYLTREAGPRVANKYVARFESLYESIANQPESCQVRPKLGAHIRVGVVHPYIL